MLSPPFQAAGGSPPCSPSSSRSEFRTTQPLCLNMHSFGLNLTRAMESKEMTDDTCTEKLGSSGLDGAALAAAWKLRGVNYSWLGVSVVGQSSWRRELPWKKLRWVLPHTASIPCLDEEKACHSQRFEGSSAWLCLRVVTHSHSGLRMLSTPLPATSIFLCLPSWLLAPASSSPAVIFRESVSVSSC